LLDNISKSGNFNMLAASGSSGNRNVNQFLQLNRLTRGYRMRKCVDTTHTEIISFIGLLFYMVLVKIT